MSEPREAKTRRADGSRLGGGRLLDTSSSSAIQGGRGVMDSYRVEKDALGEVRVPADHLWGAQTQRSIDNFPIGVGRFHWGRPVIRAFGILKKCAAEANQALGELAA